MHLPRSSPSWQGTREAPHNGSCGEVASTLVWSSATAARKTAKAATSDWREGRREVGVIFTSSFKEEIVPVAVMKT